MKPEEQFVEWEMRTFGAGYGTGELPILKAVKTFFDSLENNRSYDYEELESKLGGATTWLLINAFDKANIIEWGTSSRYGWITSCGENIRDFIKRKTPEELYKLLMSDRESICMCDGEIKDIGHENCGKNPMVNEKYAEELRYLKK